MSSGTNKGAGWVRQATRFFLVLVLAAAAIEYFLVRDLNKTLIFPSKNGSRQDTEHTLNQQETKDIFNENNFNDGHNYIEAYTPNKDPVHYNLTEGYYNINLNESGLGNSGSTALDSAILIKKISSKKALKIMDGMKKTVPLPLCDSMPPGLGPVIANKDELELKTVQEKYPEIGWGGRYTPPNCIARHKVAIIVPYRNRPQHIPIFLNHMHSFLMTQQIEYGIFIIEQEGDKAFNRAKLFNVGFLEGQKLKTGGWDCFILHDIDLLPLDTRNMYSCPKQPRHMSSSIDKFDYISLYDDIFGGVGAVTADQFINVNGFSNKYWGWGGEDMDLFKRLEKMNYHIGRYKMSIARYAMLRHEKTEPNSKRFGLLLQTSDMLLSDGLSTIEYEIIQVVEYHLYTHVLANIDERD